MALGSLRAISFQRVQINQRARHLIGSWGSFLHQACTWPAVTHPHDAGASSGFGEAIAWRCAALQCKLILLARRQERLEALRSAILEVYPSTAIHLVCMDVRNMEAVAALPSQLPQEFAEVRQLQRFRAAQWQQQMCQNLSNFTIPSHAEPG